jgi:hypothetical protein
MKVLNKFDETIGVYPEALSRDFCQKVIDLFESPGMQGCTHVGQTLQGEDHSVKNTLELDLMQHKEFDQITSELARVSNASVEDYISQWDNADNPSWNFNNLFGDEGTYYPLWQLQKYAKGEGHYNSWHMEQTAAIQWPEGVQHRIFVTMFYLNDVDEGGETRFLYSGLKIKPKAGTFVVWPPSWPWIHCGAMPISNDKYIVTTWLQGEWEKSNLATRQKDLYEKDQALQKFPSE